MTKRCVALFLVLTLSGGLVLSQETKAPSTGQKIGTIVKDAINTALPGVTTLLDLIWGKKDNGKKISKGELEKSIKDAKDDMQNKLTASAQEKIRPIDAV